MQINKLGAPELAMTISSETVGKFHQKQFLRPKMLVEFEFLARMGAACRPSSRVGGSQFQTGVFKWDIAT
jgi:hypothetical protein